MVDDIEIRLELLVTPFVYLFEVLFDSLLFLNIIRSHVQLALVLLVNLSSIFLKFCLIRSFS